MNFSVIPSLLALAILVVVFAAIVRQNSTERLDLWLLGWVLVLMHFVAEFLRVGQGLWERWMTALSVDFLELAAIAFLISFCPLVSERRHQLLLGAGLGIPMLLYSDAVVWEITAHGLYYAVIVLAFGGTAFLVWRFYGLKAAYMAGVMFWCTAVAAAMAVAVAHNRPEQGIIALLCAANFAAAFLYWQRFRPATTGVLTTAFGFLAWGAVFPCGALLQSFAPSVQVESEVWNLPKYLVAVGMILTLLEKQIQRSDYLAYHDQLTRLPNLRLLLDRMDRALAHAQRSGNKVAVLLLDLDNFKEVNDTYGHRIGDLLLQHTVLRLATRMRGSDTLSRSGGDEFTVISEVADPQGAAVLVSALKLALSVPFKLEGKLVRASASVGCAMYPDDGADADSLRAVADKAMYAAKRARRKQANAEELFPSSQPESQLV